MTERNQHNPELPEDLRSLERSLDALGEASRSEAPAGLRDRIASAGAEILRDETPQLRLAGTEASPLARFTRPWRFAAAVALLVIAGVIVVAINQPIAAPSQDAPIASSELIDELIEIETAYVADSGWDSDSYDTLQSELNDLELSLNETWDVEDALILTDGETL